MRRLARVLVGLVVVVLVLVGIGIALLETGWAKDRIRGLIVRQANQYLTATLSIGRLEGSILRGLQLGDIQLSRDGRTLVRIDEVALSYSIRELLQAGTVIRRIRLVRPRIAGRRQPDGRWDLGALVRREQKQEDRGGPGRPIEIQSIEVVDGSVDLEDPLDFGATHAPTRYAGIDASMSFVYHPVQWRLAFTRLSFVGRAPDLTIKSMTGILANGEAGFEFGGLRVETPRSEFVVNGRIVHGNRPTQLDLAVHASRFAFQEWSGVLHGLTNIAVDAAFDTTLRGPLTALGTDLRLTGTGGSVGGALTLDTTVPGWHGKGAVDVGRLDLSRWLNRRDRPSDITGHVTFDLDLDLGRHFPRGAYTFDGPHAMYMNYAADALKARGQITAQAVLVASAKARAYGADVTTTDGSIGLDEPFPYHFTGTITRIDLRNVPETVPVPRVESLLTFDYDVNGRFSDPEIAGRAAFGDSTFLGATIRAGTVGTIDTFEKPVRFTGDGELAGVDVNRFGEGLDVAWMRDRRYAGTLDGRFRVDGRGTDRQTLELTASGRVARAEFFRGVLADADVTLAIARGTLNASYSGRLASVDPAIAFDDPRMSAQLSGIATVAATVRELLWRDVTLDDYDVSGAITAERSTVRGIAVDRGHVEATLRDSALNLTDLETAGPALEARAKGTLPLTDRGATDVDYEIVRADLSQLRPLTGTEASGFFASTGRLTGADAELHAVGTASVDGLDAYDVQALTIGGQYDVVVTSGARANVAARVNGHATLVTVVGQQLSEVTGTVRDDGDRLQFDLDVAAGESRRGHIGGEALLRMKDKAVDVAALSIALGPTEWRLAGSAPSTISWTDRGISITPTTFAASAGDQRVTVGGDWRSDGTGALRLTAAHVFLEPFQNSGPAPPRYGGTVDLDATVRGTREQPLVAATLDVGNGRVDRVTYQRLTGRVEYARQTFTVDLRVDQSPGVSATANGTVPLALFRSGLPEAPIELSIRSNGANLGLVEGLTDAVRDVSGGVQVDLTVVGTSADPHFTGTLGVTGGAFQVTASGARYRNAAVSLQLARDRISVESFHIEDSSGRPLDVRGNLATHELTIGELSLEATTQRFEVMRNEFGRLEVQARVHVGGRFESPQVTGDVTIASGDLKVDQILQRALFRPYATEQAALPTDDVVAALNPWQRLGVDVALHVPNNLRLSGDSVQIATGTPLGIGDVNVRVAGDLYFYKDPGDQLYVSGSLDSVTGTFSFQSRPFNVVSPSSIVFHGDFAPELYIAVTRVISGVETRVSIIGPMRQPELRLASIPPLDESDILSLIVFNTSTNQLTALQQQELVVRAGTLAAGFVATPVIKAIQNEIGIDVLDIEPSADVFAAGPRVTIGQELAPGLVARFSRQFGQEPYDEATLEYYLSRILLLRATFSDAQSLVARSPFRRVERAGIDLLFFFSF